MFEFKCICLGISPFFIYLDIRYNEKRFDYLKEKLKGTQRKKKNN